MQTTDRLLSAKQGTCDTCGNETAVMRYDDQWMCGRCIHSASRYATAAHVRLTDRDNDWITVDGYKDVALICADGFGLTLENGPELIAALQVALARQAAAQEGKAT